MTKKIHFVKLKSEKIQLNQSEGRNLKKWMMNKIVSFAITSVFLNNHLQMKINYYIGLIIGLITLMCGKLISYSGGFFGAGYTGSPGNSGMTCVTCHSGSSVTTAQGAITSNIPASGYVPGQSYTVTVTAQHPTFNVFGFMLTAETSTGAKAGSWTITNATETQLTAGGSYVSHTSSGITGSSNMKTWTVQWTAPTPGAGTVTFYAAINRANGNGTTSGDQIQTASLQVAQFNPPPPPPLTLKIDTVLHELCVNGCNGSIQASATGGVPPVTITITGNSFINLCGGQYWVKATDSIGQADSTAVIIQNGVNPPTPDIMFDQVNLLLFTTAQAAGYMWYFNGQPIPNSNNDTLSLAGMLPGDYSVEITDQNNCRTMSAILAVNFSSFFEHQVVTLTFYPNPVKRGQPLILYHDAEPAFLSVFTAEGRLLSRQHVFPGNNVFSTDMLRPGVYILAVGNVEKSIRTAKLVVW